MVRDLEQQQQQEEPEYVELPEHGQSSSSSRAAFIAALGSALVLLCCIAAYRSPPSWRQGIGGARVSDNFLASQRTAFHFQPRKNWMNDPNGPLFYKGFYHIFYQYNPDSAVWGNITWGHAVSRDMIHWQHVDIALRPDQWYDKNGVWSGSATVLPDGNLVLLYTGSTNDSTQVQNMATPTNSSDPFLVQWSKSPDNPLLLPPSGIAPKDFRDPTTAWLEVDGAWRIVIGAKRGRTGIAMIFKSNNFTSWELEQDTMHEVEGTGMWECIDFYPVSMTSSNGLDTSLSQYYVDGNPLVKHVLKASLDDTKHDHYSLGVYSPLKHTWRPDNPQSDVGLGLRYDYGKYYASKTFYDPLKGRRVLWGWANESDSVQDDLKKGWSSVQTIPRQLYLDTLTGVNLIQWPIEEVESLRYDQVNLHKLVLPGGSLVKVNSTRGAQLDIELKFEYPNVSSIDILPETTEYDCSQGGSTHRGVYGPFGLLVLADDSLQERTAVYFYMRLTRLGKWETRVCSDQSRSSLAAGLDTTVYGTTFTVLPSESYLSLRVMVDHSIVETFAQGGRACITSRVYPTLALDEDAHLFVFNNGTQSIVLSEMAAWKMKAAN